MRLKSTFPFIDIILGLCICFGLVFMIASCSKDQAEPKKEEPKPEPKPTEKDTYEKYAGAFFQSKCTKCHTGAGPGTGNWVFSDYNSVKNNSARIKAAISDGRMPKDGPLTAAEKSKILKWFDDGLIEK